MDVLDMLYIGMLKCVQESWIYFCLAQNRVKSRFSSTYNPTAS